MGWRTISELYRGSEEIRKGGGGMRKVKIIIGANFGDDGKGMMTDFFAAKADISEGILVICSNGGAQRGHTVKTPDGIRHVFHHFGSGMMVGADTWLPGYFILNPMIFMNEYEELQSQFVTLPKIYLCEDSPVTTPFDMIINQIVEQHRGDARHGSCGVGIWETLVRNGACLGEMMRMSDSELRKYLKEECRDYMIKRLKDLGVEEISDEWMNIIYDWKLVDNYILDFKLMCRMTEVRGADIMDDYGTVIYEAGQGLLLDRNRKEYGCNTTPSNTGLRNPAEMIREYIHRKNAEASLEQGIRPHTKIDVEVCYVTRSYLTRHGAGKFEGECDKAEINAAMTDLTNVPNPYQGTIRYGKLDPEAFMNRIREDFDSERFPDECEARMSIALTHLNEYDSPISEIADYISDGETREDIYPVKGRDDYFRKTA